MGSWSIWHWLVVLAIVALVFGTKRLRNIGEDVGAAIRSFRKGMARSRRPGTTESRSAGTGRKQREQVRTSTPSR